MSWIHMLSRQLNLISIFLFLYKIEAFSANCSKSCVCTAKNRQATCHFDKSLVNMRWEEDIDYDQDDLDDIGATYLYIKCEGLNYDCTEIPKLDIKPRKVTVNITACAPSILQCVNDIYFLSSELESVLLYEVKNFTKEDFKGIKKFRMMGITLSDSYTPVSVDLLPDVSSIYISGGELHLLSNMFNNSNREVQSWISSANFKSIPADTFAGLGSLKRLHLSDNNVKCIPSAAFRGLNALQSLLISTNNTLVSIEPGVFSEIKNLETVFIGDSALKSLPNELFQSLKALESITISNNSIELNLGSKLFAISSLTYLEITHSKIRILPETVFDGSAVTYMYLSDNMIEELPAKLFWNTTSLRYIYFQGNRIQKLPKEIFAKVKYLTEINFSNNNIEELPKDLFAYNPILKFVKLNNNRVKELDLNVFNGLDLITLSLVSNQIRPIIENNSLSMKIRDLDLSDNNVEELGDWLMYLNKGLLLNVTRNNITRIKESHIYNVFHNSSITIDLRFNNVSYIIKNKEEPKKSQSKVRLYLSNNYFKCDCLVLGLLQKWKKDKLIKDYDEIICESKEYAAKVKLSSVCNKKDILIGLVGSSVVGALVLFFVVIAILTNRNKIVRKIRNIFKDSNELDSHLKRLDKLKSYDVFVSFAYDDKEFVTDELLPKLEQEFKQKVCVHYRDWIVGDLITDQIIKSVQDSRLTVIILTEHFIKSEWSYLEFRTAYNLSLQEGKAKVLVILLDEKVIDDKNLNDILKSYMTDNGYLLRTDVDFWKNLKSNLPRKGKCRKRKHLFSNTYT